MVPWIAILVGALFIWLAVRIGFYEIWCLFVNVSVSIYVAIFLAPIVIDLVPATGGLSAYSTTLSMIVLAGGCFALLYGFSYVFLTGQFSVPFPKTFDILLGGGLGFLTGFLVCSFVALVFTATPVARGDCFNDLGFDRESQKANIACIARCCDAIHSLTGSDTTDSPTQTAITMLLDRADDMSVGGSVEQPDPNEPAQAPAESPKRTLFRRPDVRT